MDDNRIVNTEPNDDKNSEPASTGSFDPPLKWHKFLIYFGLWVGALLNIYTARQMLDGSIWGDEYRQTMILGMFPGLETICVIVGVALIFLSVYVIVVRFMLARFKNGAPKMLLLNYVFNFAVSLLFIILVSKETGLPVSDFIKNILSSILGSILGMIVNGVYYSKRSYMFTN